MSYFKGLLHSVIKQVGGQRVAPMIRATQAQVVEGHSTPNYGVPNDIAGCVCSAWHWGKVTEGW